MGGGELGEIGGKQPVYWSWWGGGGEGWGLREVAGDSRFSDAGKGEGWGGGAVSKWREIAGLGKLVGGGGGSFFKIGGRQRGRMGGGGRGGVG